jgi:hypothetical protein
MSNTALELIMNFASLAVIAELDNWIGEMIVADKPFKGDDHHKDEDYDLSNLNDRMSLTDKLSYLGEDLVIIDDLNKVEEAGCIVSYTTCFLRSFPWALIPLLTVPLERLLLIIQPRQDIINGLVN